MQTSKGTTIANKSITDVDVFIGCVKNPNSNQEPNHMLNTVPTSLGWLGNPHSLNEAISLGESLRLYRSDITEKIESNDKFRQAVANISGKTIGMCTPPKRSHGIIIAKVADELAEDESLYASKKVYGYGASSGEDKKITSDGEVINL